VTILDAVTDYVARRMIEREHALVATPGGQLPLSSRRVAAGSGPSRRICRRRAALFGLALLASLRSL